MIIKWSSNSTIPFGITLKGRAFPSSGFMASYFIWWFIICYWHLFWFLSVDVASGCPFKMAPLSLWHVPIILRACSYFLIQRHSRLILYFICTSPGMGYFSKKNWFLFMENDRKKIWALGVLTAVVALLLPSPLMACMHAHTPIYLSTYIENYEFIPVLPIPTLF